MPDCILDGANEEAGVESKVVDQPRAATGSDAAKTGANEEKKEDSKIVDQAQAATENDAAKSGAQEEMGKDSKIVEQVKVATENVAVQTEEANKSQNNTTKNDGMEDDDDDDETVLFRRKSLQECLEKGIDKMVSRDDQTAQESSFSTSAPTTESTNSRTALLHQSDNVANGKLCCTIE